MIQAVPISLVHTRVAYEDECDLNVESGTSWFSIAVAKYDTETESERKFEFEFGLYISDDSDSDKYTKYLEKNSFWDGARSYYKSTNSDQVVMLRYKTIVITLIGSDYELLQKLEPILREIPFDRKLDVSNDHF